MRSTVIGSSTLGRSASLSLLVALALAFAPAALCDSPGGAPEAVAALWRETFARHPDLTQPATDKVDPFVRPACRRTLQDVPRDVPVYLMVGSTLHRLPADRVLKTLYGAAWSTCPAQLVYEKVQKDAAYQAYLRELLAVEGVPLSFVLVYDAPDQLYEGEVIYLPDGKKTKLRFDCRLDVAARAARCTVQELVQANPYRFNVRSVCLHVMPPRDARPTDPVAPSAFVVIGDSDFTYLKGTGALDGVLYHEAAHSQDFRSLGRDPFGPDGNHNPVEVTKPAPAFIEGWAEFNALGQDQRAARDVRYAMAAPLLREVAAPPGARTTATDQYLTVPFPTFDECVSCETVVTALLAGLQGTDRSGRARVLQAFHDANRREGASLITFVRSYLYRNPDELERVALTLDTVTRFTAEPSALRSILDVPTVPKERVACYLEGRPALQVRWRTVAGSALHAGLFQRELLKVLELDLATGFALRDDQLVARAEERGVFEDFVRTYLTSYRASCRARCKGKQLEGPELARAFEDVWLGDLDPARLAARLRETRAPAQAPAPRPGSSETTPGFDGLAQSQLGERAAP